MVVLMLYTNLVYVENVPKMGPSTGTGLHDHYKSEETAKGAAHQKVYTIILAVAVIYPCLYEIT